MIRHWNSKKLTEYPLIQRQAGNQKCTHAGTLNGETNEISRLLKGLALEAQADQYDDEGDQAEGIQGNEPKSNSIYKSLFFSV